jgi:TRAP-type C4-dicarboxylate transport system substrate-binding protein
MHDVVEGGPDAIVAKIADRLQKELKLDDAQKQMLQQIETETRIELRVIRADSQPRVSETLSAAEKKVRAVLRTEQQKKFDQIIQRSRDKWDRPPEAGRAEPEAKLEYPL